MSAGVFGAIGYDLIRLVEEPLPDINPDPLDLPDAILIRPSVVAVFDGIAQEIILSTTAWPSAVGAAEAHAAACARLDAVAAALRQPLPPEPVPTPEPPAAFDSPVPREGYWAIVERAKRYVEAGDVFQVVPESPLPPPHSNATRSPSTASLRQNQPLRRSYTI